MKSAKGLIGALVLTLAGGAITGTAVSMGAKPQQIVDNYYEKGVDNFSGLNLSLPDMDLSDMEEFTVSFDDMESFNEIDIKVYNCPIIIEASKDGKYSVDVNLLYHQDSDVPKVEVDNEKLVVENDRKLVVSFFNFDWSANQYVKIYVPEDKISQINAKTSNSKIEVNGLDLKNGEAELVSSNGSIIVDDVYASEVKADTSNSEISFKNVKAEVIKIDNSNGKVEMSSCEAEEYDVKTSNSKINAENIYGVSGELVTSNAAITLDGVDFLKELEVKTSNSNIDITLNGKSDDYKIKADTSNGNVYLDGKKQDKEYRDKSGDSSIVLKSSNGNIRIKYDENGDNNRDE